MMTGLTDEDDVGWVRTQVPRRVHLIAKQTATLMGINMTTLYTVLLTKALYNAEPRQLATELFQQLYGKELPVTNEYAQVIRQPVEYELPPKPGRGTRPPLLGQHPQSEPVNERPARRKPKQRTGGSA